MSVSGEVGMREEFKFRLKGTSELISFAELDKVMQEQFAFERDRIEHRLNRIAEEGILSAAQLDTIMQERLIHERDKIDKKLIEVFDTRLKQKNDSIGFLRADEALHKFR